MLYSVVLVACLAGYAAASDCPSSVENAYFKGECSSSSDYNWYSFSTLQTALTKFWREDITTNIATAKAELSAELTSCRTYANEMISEMNETLSNMKDQTSEASVSPIVSEHTQAIANLIAGLEAVQAQNQELKTANEELKKEIDLLKAGAGRGRVVGPYHPEQSQGRDFDLSNSSLVKTVCKVREALGVELTETCMEILHPGPPLYQPLIQQAAA